MTGDAPARIVVMGVTSAGKSTVAAALAAELGVTFVDADGLHPATNVAKMAAGTPLTDEDRWPWLDIVGAHLGAEGNTGVVTACSALRRRYRDRIRQAAPSAVFVHLDGARELLEKRMQQREGHFMPTSLLASQIATLEPLEPDEAGFVLDVDRSESEIVAAALVSLTHIPPREHAGG